MPRRLPPVLSLQIRLLIVAVFLLGSLPPSADAQQRADPVAVGQARSAVATARGLSSLYSNVGALGLDDLGPHSGHEPSVQIDASALPIGISAGSTYLSASELNFVFASKDCGVFTDADRLRLSRLVAGDKLSADAAFDLAALRIRVPGVGAMALRFGHRIRARMSFPENFRTSVLGTDDIFAHDYRFDGADVGGEWLRGFGAALATSWHRAGVDRNSTSWLPEIGFGLRVDRQEGIAHFDLDPSSVVTTTVLRSTEPGGARRMIAVAGHYAFRTSAPVDFEPAQAIVRPGFSDADSNLGSGWSTNLGVSVVLLRTVDRHRDVRMGTPLDPQQVIRDDVVTRDALTLGFSVDEIGSMRWDGFNLVRHRTIDSVMTDEGGGLNYGMLCEYTGELDTVGAFTTSLPTRFRVGAGIDVTAFAHAIPGDLIIGTEGAVDLVDGAVGGERHPRFSVGGTWRPLRWFSLRAGLQLGGLSGTGFSLGAGLQPFSWLSIDAATSQFNSLLESDPDSYDLALRVATRVSL